MYIYNILNKNNNIEKILSPFLIKRGLINETMINIDKPIKNIDLKLEKCNPTLIVLDNDDKVIESKSVDKLVYPVNKNEYVILEDYRSFIIYTMNDRYEYCSYCDLIANKRLDNCHICHRKKCGSCEDFESICNYCNTNIII